MKKDRSRRVLARLVAQELTDEVLQSISGGCDGGPTGTCTPDGPDDDSGGNPGGILTRG